MLDLLLRLSYGLNMSSWYSLFFMYFHIHVSFHACLFLSIIQAFLCELSEIRPIHGSWSEECQLRFLDLVPLGSKEFIGKVCFLWVIHSKYPCNIDRNKIVYATF